MKKFLVAILAVIYLGTSVGATVNLHYCMGKLVEESASNSESGTCGKCGMKKSHGKHKGCCHDEHKFVKNDTGHKAAESPIVMMAAPALAVLPGFVELPSPAVSAVTEESPVSHAPPRSTDVAIYLLNRVILI